RELAEAITAALQLGLTHAREAELPKIAWECVSVIEEKLKPDIDPNDPLADIERRIDALKVEFEGKLEKAKAALKKSKDALFKEAQKLKVDLANAVNREAVEGILAEEESAEEKIKRLEAQFAYVQRRYKAVEKLLIKYVGKDDIKGLTAKQFGDLILDAAKQELAGQLEAYKQQLNDAAKQYGDDLLAHALGAVELLAIQAKQSVAFQAIRRAVEDKADEWCGAEGNISAAYNMVAGLVLESGPSVANLKDSLENLNDEVTNLKLPAETPDPIKSKLELEFTALSRTVNKLVEALQNFQRWRIRIAELRQKNENICLNARKYLEPIEAVYESRYEAVLIISDIFRDLERIQSTAAVLSDPSVLDAVFNKIVKNALKPILKEITSLVELGKGSLKSSTSDFFDLTDKASGELKKQIDKKIDELAVKASEFQTDIDSKNNTDFTGLQEIGNRINSQITRCEKEIAGRILQSIVLGDNVVKSLALNSVRAVNKLTKYLDEGVYSKVVKAIDDINLLFAKSADDQAGMLELIALLADPAIQDLKRAKTRIEDDQEKITAVKKTSNDFLNANANLSDYKTAADNLILAIEDLEDKWGSNKPGLLDAMEIVIRLAESLSKGQLSELFDFSVIEKELKKALAELIPAKINLNYDWDTKLDPFPSGSPLFEIDRATVPFPELGFILPKTEDGKTNDLVLGARIKINLITGSREVVAKGQMKPFKIHLLGDAIDLVTIGFKGMEVTSKNGGKPKFKADINEVEIGQALEFIQALGSLMGPKPDNGPYVRISLSPLGVLAGYRYSAPAIPVGTLIFSNIAIGVEMILPFEDQQATFSFVFARRRKPFLVSQPPYGGGGFVGLLASPKGIIGFEIQIEFGAVVPIEFGPLEAQGRVTAGIYLMSRPGQRVLEGFVRAVGEGNIACFSISVLIEVTIRQQNGGTMIGSSTFAFSFKVGFVEVSYSFTAKYEVEGGGGGGTSGRSREGDRVLDQPPGMAAKSLGENKNKSEPCATIQTFVPNKKKDWGNYRKRFYKVGV
ncbi:MAG: hypothetical protein GY761_01300, partial [Hyphomicrobiales bacterium]|nr:hypothetical protein [Hyphomicrobiales bacterium]